MFGEKYSEPSTKAWKEGFRQGFTLITSLATLLISCVALYIRFH